MLADAYMHVCNSKKIKGYFNHSSSTVAKYMFRSISVLDFFPAAIGTENLIIALHSQLSHGLEE